MSGSDNLEIATKPHPYIFNAAGKRSPAALTTGRDMKKPKGVVKKTVPTGPYSDFNGGKYPAIDRMETIVVQAGKVADKEVELEVPMMDVSTACSPIQGSQKLGKITARRYSMALQGSCDPLHSF